MYKKLTKNEINVIMNKIDPIYLIDTQVHKEKFRQIKFKGMYTQYIISSIGRVFSINYKGIKNNLMQLKTHYDRDGYEFIGFNINGKSYGCFVHKLVALHFIKNKNPNKFTQVNHIDGVKTHNYCYNLEWVTPKENIQHAWKTGLSKSIGENNGRNTYPSRKIKDVCVLLESNVPLYEISRITGVSYAMISLILRHKNWIEISKNYNFDNYSYGK